MAGNTSKKSAKIAKKTAAKRVAAKPTLLAGGNPQIAKAARTPSPLADILRPLRSGQVSLEAFQDNRRSQRRSSLAGIPSPLCVTAFTRYQR